MQVQITLDTAVAEDIEILEGLFSGTVTKPAPVKEEKPKRKRGPNKKKVTPPADPKPTPIEAEAAAPAPAPEPEPAAPAAETPTTLDDEQVRELFKSYAGGIGYKNALAFLQENFGVKRLSLVPADQYGKLIELINAA